MKRIGRRHLLWLALLGVDLLIVAGIGELWVRAFVPVKDVCWTMDETLGMHRCPNQRRVGYVEPGHWNLLITNSLGFHDFERKVEKEAGVYRIHIYGDSLIVGSAVQREATIPAAVERRLNASVVGVRFEVVNMGTVDSTTSQLLTWEKIGRRFQPDLVVCNFMDDFHDNLAEVHRRIHAPHHGLDESGELVFMSAAPKDFDRRWERFKRFSQLYRLTVNKYLGSRMHGRLRTVWRNLKAGGDWRDERRRLTIEQGWPLTLRLFEEFRERVEAEGSQFVIVDGFKLRDGNVGTVYGNRDIEKFAAGRGITYAATWQMLDDLRTSEERERLFFRDEHPTAEGNEILGAHMAERLLVAMEEQGLVTGGERRSWIH